jgi:hypothetical protein
MGTRKERKMSKRIAYRKSHIDQYYHFKHFGAWLGTYCLVMYDRLSQGFPENKQEWILFALINLAYIFGATNSLLGSKKVAG